MDIVKNRGQLLLNESLAQYTSWRVGGIAKQLYKPADLSDLQRFLSELPKAEPLLFLGLGSNTLIRDGGFHGTVIATQGALKKIEAINPQTIRAEAGVSCAQAARFFARSALQGGEFLAGIPGTIGGALAMNAGCFNGETWNIVTSVETISRDGTIHTREPSDFSIGYRHVVSAADAEEWFISGTFTLQPGDKQISLDKITQLLDRRYQTQPTNEPSCGSVFRNPPNDHAGRLIESCGLKGFALGGAIVSEKHANFILNRNHASASDIENLILHIQQVVFEKTKIQLVPEAKIIGEK